MTVESPHDLLHSSSSHCVKCFHEISEHHIQPLVFFLIILLQLLENKHHICCSPVSSEAALTLWKVVFHDGGYQPIQLCFQISGGNPSSPAALPHFSYFVDFVVSSMVGNSSCSIFTGCWDMWRNAGSWTSTEEGLENWVILLRNIIYHNIIIVTT